MVQENRSSSKNILIIFLAFMGVMIAAGIFFPEGLKALLDQPALYHHVLFAHILVVALFFANAVIGILWELRSLMTGRREIIIHTYDTVAWLDARFSSPLIILSVITGIMLSLLYGSFLETGWLILAFVLFILSGLVWVVADIPAQYRIKKMIGQSDPAAAELSGELMMLLKRRLIISLAGVLPLLFVFALMVYKPEIAIF